MTIFIELSFILVVATIIALCMRLLRQPLIIGYILTGILVGPTVFNLVNSHDQIEVFSKIGISILLFLVGLTLNPDIIREVGRASSLSGIGQVIATSIMGWVLARLLGIDGASALYIAIALTFSSTIIVLKLLSDREDIDKLYGKITVGVLLVQDVVAIILLVGIPAFARVGGTGTVESVGFELLSLFAIGGATTIALYGVSKYAVSRLVAVVGGNQEVLLIFSLAWGLGLASLYHLMGFSIEIGALLAGAMLAVSPFAYEISARMKSLRDFFVLVFFVQLGAQMELSELSQIVVPAIILSLLVLVGKPLGMFTILNVLGYRTKTAFMSALAIAQISEFSLILVASGYTLGHIPQEIVSLVTLVGIITIAGSASLMLYADELYTVLKPLLEIISIRKHHHREWGAPIESPDIILFGYDRVGNEFASVAADISPRFLVVDYNPQSIQRLQNKNIPFRYGDAEDVEFLQEIGFGNARLIVSTIPEYKASLLLVRFYRKHNPEGAIIVLAHRVEEATELYASGATYVVMPHHLGAHHAALLIARHGFNVNGFNKERNLHLAKLIPMPHRRRSSKARNLTLKTVAR